MARGGGSLADLLCFCDETLCRTVALLGVPVIASVGHHTDRTLLDDVAAVSCSTPTHAAGGRRGRGLRRARGSAPRPPRLRDHAGRRCATSAGGLSPAGDALARAGRAPRPPAHAPSPAAARDARGRRRRIESERRLTGQRALVLQRKADSSLLDCRRRRPRELERLALALAGHDPQRTLERGYVLVQSSDGEPLLQRCARPRGRRGEAAVRRRHASREDPQR